MISGEPFARGRENKETRLRPMTLAEVGSTSVTIRIRGFMAPILNAVTQSYIRRMPYTLVSVHSLGLAKKTSVFANFDCQTPYYTKNEARAETFPFNASSGRPPLLSKSLADFTRARGARLASARKIKCRDRRDPRDQCSDGRQTSRAHLSKARGRKPNCRGQFRIGQFRTGQFADREVAIQKRVLQPHHRKLESVENDPGSHKTARPGGRRSYLAVVFGSACRASFSK